MKILIVGSRSITDYDLSKLISEEVTMIISGGAKGVDALAEKYADENRISKMILQPDYKKYGRAAPLKRNEEMVRICDTVLVIWDGISRGSAYTIKYARKIGKPIKIITVEKQ